MKMVEEKEFEKPVEDLDSKIDREKNKKIEEILEIEDVNERIKRWNEEFPNSPIGILK